jgi:hypothetical protein
MSNAALDAYSDYQNKAQEWQNVYNRNKELYGNEAQERNITQQNAIANVSRMNSNSMADKSFDANRIKEQTSAVQSQIDEMNKQNAQRQAQIAEKNAGDMAANAAQQQAQAQMKANRNAGVNSAASSLVGTADAANNYSNANQGMKQTLANQNASTQADYLGKLGYANNLQQTASNTQNAQGLLTAGATLTGAGQGALAGLQMFGSDERLKEAIDSCDDEDLKNKTLSMIKQFEEMAAKLQELKKENK